MSDRTRSPSWRDRLTRAAAIFFVALLIVPILALVRFSDLCDLRVSGCYFVLISAATFLVYRHDKARAQTGGWRIPETTLHILEAFGGWPGALLAQRFLRHKTSKTSYRVTFWAIVAIHQLLALDYLLDWWIVRKMASLF